MLDLQPHAEGTILPVRAHAGAKRDAIEGVRDGALRVSVTKAPEQGQANRAIVALLSKSLKVPKSSWKIISGATSPQKRFLFCGGSTEELREAIERLLGHLD